MTDKKITPVMKEVIELLRAGYFIYSGFNNYIQVSKTHLSYSKKVIQRTTLYGLSDRKIIISGKVIGPYLVYTLTDLGKTIEL